MRKSILALATGAAIGVAAAAPAATIRTGAFDANDGFFDTAAIGLGPGRYRFTLAVSTPVENLLGNAEKITVTQEYCDFGDGEVACGGDDVPTQPEFEQVAPLLYQTALTVDAPYTLTLSSPFTRAETSDLCCTFQYGFDTLAAGSYTLSYAALPEPGSWAAMAAGLFALGGAARRRRARAPAFA